MLKSASLIPTIAWDCLSHMIGKTPLIRLDLRCKGRDLRIYAKAEMYNLSGSIKDRMALAILKGALERGDLQIGQRVVEATSGSSGIALAAIGSAIGCPVTIFMPDWMSAERKALVQSYGADLRLVSREEGGFLGAMARANDFATEQCAFLANQFSNRDNLEAHYCDTAPEMLTQIASDWKAEGDAIGAFVAGVGTGGTVMGIGRYLKEHLTQVEVHPIEPASSPILTKGHKTGSHRIQGMVDEFVPDLVELSRLDPIIAVEDGDAIAMAQKLCAHAGLGVGISSGANLIGAINTALARDDGKPVATVFCDSNVRYLSTDLFRCEPMREDYTAPHVEIKKVTVIDCNLARA